jgi:hypothetical protein
MSNDNELKEIKEPLPEQQQQQPAEQKPAEPPPPQAQLAADGSSENPTP